MYRGKPEIILIDPSELRLKRDAAFLALIVSASV
jgi:hypothetical protein